jgi:hypothetical protein
MRLACVCARLRWPAARADRPASSRCPPADRERGCGFLISRCRG